MNILLGLSFYFGLPVYILYKLGWKSLPLYFICFLFFIFTTVCSFTLAGVINLFFVSGWDGLWRNYDFQFLSTSFMNQDHDLIGPILLGLPIRMFLDLVYIYFVFLFKFGTIYTWVITIWTWIIAYNFLLPYLDKKNHTLTHNGEH